MAKYIIKNGKYNVITCSECGCEFTFERTDIKPDGTVLCPQCAKENTPVTKSK